MSRLLFYNPFAHIRVTRDRLPHWEQRGRIYFITFRLGDSFPSALLKDLESQRSEWLRRNPEPWKSEHEVEYHKRFAGQIERALDLGHGSCLLRHSENRVPIAEALRFFDNDRYLQLSFVIMPNHIHTLFIQNPGWALEKIVRSWKSYAARQINALRDQSGSVWQRDYFDRLIRDEQHFRDCVKYIRRNPERARLLPEEFTFYEHDFVRTIK